MKREPNPVRKVLALLLTIFLVSAGVIMDGAKSVALESSSQITVKAKNKIDSTITANQDGLVDVLVTFQDDAPDRRLGEAKRLLGSQASPAAISLKAAQLRAQAAQKSAQVFLANNSKVKKYESLEIANTIRVLGKQEILPGLAMLSPVMSITPNRLAQMIVPSKTSQAVGGTSRSASINQEAEIEANLRAIRVDKVWKDKNITGSGVTIGLIDQGVDYQHPALRSHFRGFDAKTGKFVLKGNYIDFVGSGTTDNHGTHVAGIMVGSEMRKTGNKTVEVNRIGVAPGAKFIAARAFRDGVGGSNANIIKACQWMLAPGGDSAKAPRIINQSWSDGSNKADPWLEEVSKTIREAGILNVFSAGNNGAVKAAPGSVDNPGSMPGVLSVGAVNNTGKLADFSRRGPSQWKNAGIKPDLVAPGVQIRSALPGGKYASWDGTSGAAPHVSGLAALVLQANPQLSVNELEAILKSNTRNGTDDEYPQTPNYGYGYGVIDAYDAVQSALQKAGKIPAGEKLGSLSGTVSAATTVNTELPTIIQLPKRAYVSRKLPALVNLQEPNKCRSISLLLTKDGEEIAREKLAISSANNEKSYEISIPAEKITAPGNYEIKVQVETTSNRIYETSKASVQVQAAILPGSYFNDFEKLSTGIDTEGDFRVSTVNLQTDPRPVTGERILGLNPNQHGMGTAEQSTFQLPRIDLTKVVPSDKVELVFQENASWAGGVIGFQAVSVPKAPGEKAEGLFNYPTEIKQEGWVERRVDLSKFAGKTIDLFAFSLNKGGVSGDGWSIDNLSLLLNGKGESTNTDPVPHTVLQLNLKGEDSSGYEALAAAIEIPQLGLKLLADEKSGKYSIPKIPAGTYDVYIGHSGYATQKHSVKVQPDKDLKLDVILEKEKPGGAEEPEIENLQNSVPPTDKQVGRREIAYDNNNPLAGGILHSKVGRGVAIDVNGGDHTQLRKVHIFGAGNNPYLQAGQMRLSVKSINSLGRVIDVVKPRLIKIVPGKWNEINLVSDKIAGNRQLYITVEQVSLSGNTTAVALDSSVRPKTGAVQHAYLYTGEFLPLISGGYFGVPMIRAEFGTTDRNDKAVSPVQPKFASEVSLTPVADALVSDEQKPKDLLTIGDWEISPSRGMITKWLKLKEFLEKPSEQQNLEIPEVIGGVKITSIGAGVFKNPTWGIKNVAKVQIPEGVTEVNSEAFYNLGIKELKLPSSLERIYSSAFQNLRVTQLELPDNLRHIGDNAFAYCRKLKELKIPNSVEYLGRAAFEEAESLTLLKLPNNPKFTEIATMAFQNAEKLKQVEIPESVKIIKPNAFARPFAFDRGGIEHLKLPEGLESIENNAFIGNSLSQLRIPDSVQEVAESAFEGNQIESLIFGAELKKLGASSFEGNSLKKVVFTEKIQTVGRRAFADNPLEMVRLNRTIKPYDKNQKIGLHEYALPNAIGSLEIYRDDQVNKQIKESLTRDDGTLPEIKVVSDTENQFEDKTSKIVGKIIALNAGKASKMMAEELPQTESILASLNRQLQDNPYQRLEVKHLLQVDLLDDEKESVPWQGTLKVKLPLEEDSSVSIYTRPLGSKGNWTLRTVDYSQTGFAVIDLSTASEIAVVKIALKMLDLPGIIDYGFLAPWMSPYKAPLPIDPHPGASNNEGENNASPGNGSILEKAGLKEGSTGGNESNKRETSNKRGNSLVNTGTFTDLLALSLGSMLCFIAGGALLMRRREKNLR